MLKGKEIAAVSKKATALIRQANAAYAAFDAQCNGLEVPEGSPCLADSETVAFYANAEDAAAAVAGEDVDPIFFDTNYHKKKKHNKWELVDDPFIAKRSPLVDSHAHVHMLSNPGLAIARAGAASVRFLGLVTDPSEDGTVVFDSLEAWNMEAALLVRSLVPKC
jgi:hypothetical protein